MAVGASTANWYLDPNGQMRWWDGQAWTAHVATPGAGVPSRAGAADKVNPLAVVALVCGFIPTIGMVAIGLGWIAINQIKAVGGRGRIPAIIGVTFGSLWLLAWLLAAIQILGTRP